MSRSAYRCRVADYRRTTRHVPDAPGRFSTRGIWVWNVLLWAVTAFIVLVPETAFEWASGLCGDRPVGAEPLHWVVYDRLIMVLGFNVWLHITLALICCIWRRWKLAAWAAVACLVTSGAFELAIRTHPWSFYPYF